jgi:hypothetical protein
MLSTNNGDYDPVIEDGGPSNPRPATNYSPQSNRVRSHTSQAKLFALVCNGHVSWLTQTLLPPLPKQIRTH